MRSSERSVELAVDDDNEVPRFVVFDREVSKKDANILALAEMRGDEGPELPNCVELLSGKESFFTISAVTEISSLALSQRWSSSSSQAPVVDVQAGQATSSASNTVDAAKRAMGVDEAKLPSFEDEPNSPNAP
ncbi:hypothetical protein HID58_005610 [Brassica napus]|uniref:Uncharacterized protein n=1 Tax=Brassica napus TaxID=3708 RepID=A0ABQ8DYZ0_BRANA|nr:hypothetical protein HID58_010817 [Brassica napus]KAH0938149.1 hypothetical protein HID58_005610 [Brassica napus]